MFLGSVEEQFNPLLPFVKMFSRPGFSLKSKKRFIFEDLIDYSGDIIHPGTLDFSPEVTDTIGRLQHHTNVTELKSFLGHFNEFRPFVPNFALIAASLNCKWKMD